MEADNTSEEVTPSKKKLTQARLPFMIISDAASVPVSPISRKRKLSSEESEAVAKIGKLSKENDSVTTDLVVISDDENDVKESLELEVNPVNPFVKLVDNARKKKLQKKRKNDKKTKKISLSESATRSSKNDESDCIIQENENKEGSNKIMDVDEIILINDNEQCKELHSPNTTLSNVIEPNSTLKKQTSEEQAIENNTEESVLKVSNENQITPKRSKRIKESLENKEKNIDMNVSNLSSKMDDTTNTDIVTVTTPKNTSTSPSTKSQQSEQLNDSNLTPKQVTKALS